MLLYNFCAAFRIMRKSPALGLSICGPPRCFAKSSPWRPVTCFSLQPKGRLVLQNPTSICDRVATKRIPTQYIYLRLSRKSQPTNPAGISTFHVTEAQLSCQQNSATELQLDLNGSELTPNCEPFASVNRDVTNPFQVSLAEPPRLA